MKGFSEVLLSLLSFQGPHTSGNLESRNKKGKGLYKRTGSQVHAWDDNYNNSSRNSASRTLAGRQTLRDDDKKCIVSCCRFGGLRHYKNSVAPLIKRARTVCRLQGRGFTLIELLVVVLIIGILAGVAVPQYTKAVLKARYTELQTTIFAFKNAAEVYYMANGDYPHSWDDTDLDLPAGCRLNTGTDRGWMYCKNNQLSFDFFDANNQNLVGVYSVNGILKVGYIQWLGNSPYPAQRECWARTQDEEGTSFCKSLGGVVGPTVSHYACTTNGGCTRYILP
ncbi:type IV pilin protein [Candidatus Avelusimicrobium stercoris]|uniref:type IV pilin protein n=1 Tax=Candidatus Avelusimicrobium stercoris TaxID=1947924 RepID=UPI003D134C7C